MRRPRYLDGPGEDRVNGVNAGVGVGPMKRRRRIGIKVERLIPSTTVT